VAKRRRLAVAALSVAAHVGILLALVRAQPDPPRLAEPQVIQVALYTPPPPPEPPKPPDPVKSPAPAKAPEPKKKPEPAKPKPPRLAARPARTPPREVPPLLAATGKSTADVAEVSDADLAGAGTAESGGGSSGGGACNMTRRLQQALRKDPLIQSAVAQAHRGQAILVWNGDWVRHAEQDGAGLAAVREAILWEVGFAPAACRTERVHGLILISMNDGPGAARLVVGHGDWRWADLLGARGGRTYER
jgi:outer membrane biosynthesis protein TonB